MVQSHYFYPDSNLSHHYKNIAYQFSDYSFVFQTDRGVFSRDKIDQGTSHMLKAVSKDLDLKMKGAARCLDFGCGYGVVSIVLNTIFPEQEWLAVDVNPRAVELAKRNIKKNNLKIEVLESDGIPEATMIFDLILLNPPIRTGKKSYFQMFDQAAQALDNLGVFYIVIQKKQGALSAFKFLTSIFEDIKTIDRSGGYHTIRCQKPLKIKERI